MPSTEPDGTRTPVLISGIRRLGTRDGPGARTTVLFKGCPLRCHWCETPEALRPEPEVLWLADLCEQRGECVAACPRSALEVGTRCADPAGCEACGYCEDACPKGARRVVGRRRWVDELLDEIAKDSPFFQTSGGGLTLSGGEPTFQLDAMTALARGAKSLGISVGLQTCGLFRWSLFEPHVGLFSFIHFDLKIIDSSEHRRLTGASNDLILDNARRLVALRAPVVFRAVVVPGVSDAAENLVRMASFLRSLEVPSLELIRYRRKGLTKLPALRFPIPELDAGDSNKSVAALRRAAKALAALGIETPRTPI